MKKNKWKKESANAEELLKLLKKKDKVTLLYGNGAQLSNKLPKYDVPSFSMCDGSNGIALNCDLKSLCFPSSAALASTWNKTLATDLGKALAYEAIKANTDVILAPSLGIKRNPLNGANFNLYSEDPILTGKIGAAFALGIQSEGVGACFKDFVCSNQMTSFAHMDAQVDMRALKEIYLKAFEIGVKESDPWMVMTAYNKINGTDCSNNPYLLNDILKKEMKFRGVVVSDWNACPSPILSHNSGIDLEMPCFVKRSGDLLCALKKKKLDSDKVDDSAKRILTLALKAKERPKMAAISDEDQYNILEEVAEESVVLAKNSDGILPLRSYKDTCVIGALAETFQISGKCEKCVNPKLSDSLLREISKYCNESGHSLAYAPGYSLKENVSQSEAERLMIDAEELASRCKNVVYVVGSLPYDESEEYDRQNMRLPASQIATFKHIYEHNKNVILVVVSGTPYELPMAEEAKAIVICYFGGEMSAKALHRILIGRVNPSGRLPETWPLSYSSVPSSCFYPIYKVPSPYKESIYVGYRYYASAGLDVLFPFGHGLSYSRIVYKEPSLDKNALNEGEKIEASLKVYNMSRRKVKETVQFYVSCKGGNVFRPIVELKDFIKVDLDEGETKQVKTTLSYKDFAYFDIETNQWQVEEGKYDILAGKSSDSLQLIGKITIKSNFKKPHKEALPSYYYFTNKSLFIPSDNEFEKLLGHRIKNRSLYNGDAFSFESTLKNVSEKKIGKKIIEELQKQMDPSLSKAHQKQWTANKIEMPIRLLNNYGAKENKLMSCLNLANGNIISALFHLIGGRRK